MSRRNLPSCKEQHVKKLKKPLKLKLKAETIKPLRPADLAQAAGGWSNHVSAHIKCVG
jgi:hypothetical protein